MYWEGESKCNDKYVEKVFKWSELHLSEMTSSKIHTLGSREIDLGTFTSTPSDYWQLYNDWIFRHCFFTIFLTIYFSYQNSKVYSNVNRLCKYLLWFLKIKDLRDCSCSLFDNVTLFLKNVYCDFKTVYSRLLELFFFW